MMPILDMLHFLGSRLRGAEIRAGRGEQPTRLLLTSAFDRETSSGLDYAAVAAWNGPLTPEEWILLGEIDAAIMRLPPGAPRKQAVLLVDNIRRSLDGPSSRELLADLRATRPC